MKRISIVGSVGIPACYGGFETFVENFVETMHSEAHITVFCSGKTYAEQPRSYKGARLKYINLKANGLQSILYDGVSLMRAAFTSDACLVLGVSGAIFFPLFRLISPAKLVCNIDGTEWKRKKWSGAAKVFLRFSEYLAVKLAHVVIADSQIIKDYIRAEYNRPSTFIPYGGDHVRVRDFGEALFEEFSLERGNYYLNIARIEPENNSGTILEAFSLMPDKVFVIFGDWQGSTYANELWMRFHMFPNIRMLGTMFERQQEKNCIRANCKAYIHGHSVGGTSPALVEALTLGRIPICFEVNYNRSTCDDLGFYFQSASDLIEAVMTFEQFADVEKIRAELLELCEARYLWKNVCGAYLQVLND